MRHGRPTRRSPDVHSGDEVFTGTRVPVANLIAILEQGGSIQDFLQSFPSVEQWQVQAVLRERRNQDDVGNASTE